jgi:hypothetical protein
MANPSRIAVLHGALTLSLAFAPALQAQLSRATVIGTIRDTSGTPVALVSVTSSGLRTVTDSGGRFHLPGLPEGRVAITVRRLGYEPRDTAVQLASGRTDSLLLVLTILPRELAGITTEADAMARVRLAEFYRHRQSGQGYYFNRQEIEEKKVIRTSDLLRRLPGIRMHTDRTGRAVMRMGRASGGRDCPPDFWIDGVRAAFLNVDDVPLQDVEALEVYKGPSGLPPEINNRFGNPGCGAVVIWTRLPG